MTNSKRFDDVLTEFSAHLKQLGMLLREQQTKRSHSGKLPHRSLVIGPKHSGKSSFLSQSKLDFNQYSSNGDTECLTWMFERGIFFELPSELFEAKDDERDAITEYVKAIKKAPRIRGIDSLVLVLNIQDLLAPSGQELKDKLKPYEDLVKCIGHALKRPCPLYLIFSHTDKIAGFCDFFNKISKTERQQSWGCLLAPKSSATEKQKQLANKYDDLLQNLSSHLITRLHETRNHLKRYLIREFPLQLESIKQNVLYLCERLDECNANIELRGFFLTSSRQKGAAVDNISKTVNHNYELAIPSQVPQAPKEQAYFIRDTLLCVMSHRERDNQGGRNKYTKPALLTATLALGICSLTVLYQFERSKKHLDLAKQALAQYQQLQDLIGAAPSSNLQSLTPSLVHLSKAKSNLAKTQSPWFLPFNNLQQIEQLVNAKFNDSLHHDFLPQMVNQLEQKLVNRSTPPFELYQALKAYLMLGKPDRLSMDYLHRWYHKQWDKKIDPDQIDQRLNLLNASLRSPFPGIPLNASIVNNVRNYLNSIPRNFLAYSMIKKHFIHQSSKIEIAGFMFVDKNIPKIYTKEGFKIVQEQLLPLYTQHFSKSDWVLENKTSIQDTNLAKETLNLYISDYKNWWILFINRSQPMIFKDYGSAAKIFKLFSEQHSPIAKLVSIIQYNTSSYANPKDATQILFNQNIASQFTQINLLSTRNLETLNTIFADLNHYFNTLNHAPNADKVAFEIAKNRFLNDKLNDPIHALFQASQQTPTPVDIWLNRMATNSWYLIINQTQRYINEQWSNSIYQYYTRNIAGFYPFDLNAEQELSLSRFNAFFSHNGMMARFFNQYIKPFIDTSNAVWKAKTLDNQSLPFSRHAIDELERFNVIRQMFYPNHSSSPHVSFSLQAIALQPVISSLRFDINGKNHADTQTSMEPEQYVWPDDFIKQSTSISVENLSGEKFTLTEQGPWSWFKLLQQASLSHSNTDTRVFNLIFDINGNAARYQMTTSNAINPFIPDFIQEFKLPMKLIS